MGNEEFKERRECVVGIDIGSSTVTMSIGYKCKDGLLDIQGVEIQSVGDSVKDGTILNIVELGSAISTAKMELEKYLDITLKDAYVGISGSEVYCARYEDFVYISSPNSLITDADIRDLTERIQKVSTNSEDQIVERVLQRYIIDDRQEVKNPVGAFGSKLSAEYLLVLCRKRQIERIKQTLYQAGLEFRGLCVNPMVQHLALLNSEEMEAGVAIVDIGSDLTDISVIRQDKVCFFASLPIGASSINNDLSQFVSASKSNIEKLKRTHGSAIAENIPITATCSVEVLGHSRKQILQRNVVEIIEERLKDIARFVMKALKDAKLSSKIPGGVVLTGGSTYLSNIAELFAREMNMTVRCANTLYGINEESKGSVLPHTQSVVVGIMLYAAQHANCIVNDKPQVKPIATPLHQTPTGVPTTPTQQTGTTTTTIQPTPQPTKVEPTKVDDESKEQEKEVKQESEKMPKKGGNRSIFDGISSFLNRLISGDNDNDNGYLL